MVLDEICSRTNFNPTFPCIQHQKYMLIRLKWFTIQHLNSNTISNVYFSVFERLNVYSNVFIKNNKRWSY